MKKVFLMGCLMALWGSFVHAQSGSVQLEINNIDADKGGNLIISLYDDEESYPKAGESIQVQIMEVTASSMRHTFKGLVDGNYAVVAFQDYDKSKSLRKNFIGMPKEPIGFSQNNKISFGAPSFEESRFQVMQGAVSNLKINLVSY